MVNGRPRPSTMTSNESTGIASGRKPAAAMAPDVIGIPDLDAWGATAKFEEAGFRPAEVSDQPCHVTATGRSLGRDPHGARVGRGRAV